MNADLEHLVVLQAQDLELKRLRQELAEAPRRVAAAEAARAKSEAALTAAKTALLKEETLRRSQEVDIAERRTKIARLRKQMETATSAAQITALEHEIQFSEEAIAKLEDEELASLERTDQQEAAKSAAAKALEENTAALAAERASGIALVARNDAAIVAIEAERKAQMCIRDRGAGLPGRLLHRLHCRRQHLLRVAGGNGHQAVLQLHLLLRQRRCLHTRDDGRRRTIRLLSLRR